MKDLIGQRFGRLTVVARADPIKDPKSGKAYPRWHCRCDCGNEIDVRAASLGRCTFSCGCLRKERAAAATKKDLTGQRFGRLEVIEKARLEKPEANGIVSGWLCRCDCGNEVIVPARALTCAGKQSCGCLIAEKSSQRIDKDGGNVFRLFDSTMISALESDKARAENKTGVRGVTWSERDQCYRARLVLRGKEIYLGKFRTLEEAVAARKDGEKEYYLPVILQYEEERKMKEKIFIEIWRDALTASSREEFVSDWALSSAWGGAERAEIPQERLEYIDRIWCAAHMSIKDIAASADMSARKLAEKFNIPYRTVEDWCAQKRTPPDYVRLMLMECLGLIKR